MSNEITQEYVKSLFIYKDGDLYWKISRTNRIKIGDKAGFIHPTGYKYIRINNKNHRTHRIIFLYHHGFLPQYLDHIDQDKLNNKIENLREVTRIQNGMNRKSYKNSSSKYKGVSWNKQNQKWVSYITINKKRKHLGSFINESDAAKIYNSAAIEYYGKYAYLNEVNKNV